MSSYNIHTTTTLTSQPVPIKKRTAMTTIRNQQPIITYTIDDKQKTPEKQTTYAITRTYMAPNGTTKTKTIEYYGDEAKRLINEMKERELVETKTVDNELITTIEEQFDNIKNPDLWLEHGFVEPPAPATTTTTTELITTTSKPATKNTIVYFNDDQTNIYQYEEEPVRIINRIKHQQKGCYPSKKHSTQTSNFLFIKEALDEHNRFRYIHRVPYLKLNKELCNLAQQWAEQIANSGRFEHSNNKYLGQSLGENIAMRYTSTGEELDGKQMTDQWYEEAASYNYNLDFQSGKGHFAQIAWKNTREVGFGRAQSKDGKWYAVANYYPAGNYIGHFRENVFQPLSSN